MPKAVSIITETLRYLLFHLKLYPISLTNIYWKNDHSASLLLHRYFAVSMIRHWRTGRPISPVIDNQYFDISQVQILRLVCTIVTTE